MSTVEAPVMAPDGVRIQRMLPRGRYALLEVFIGIDRVPAMREIAGKGRSPEAFAKGVKVKISGESGYMYVDNDDGTVVISRDYLRNGELEQVYVDILHELVHVRQQREGKDLFDGKYIYTERPTELEAYVLSVREGRRLGWDDAKLAEYLRVEWITKEQHLHLLDTLGIRP